MHARARSTAHNFRPEILYLHDRNPVACPIRKSPRIGRGILKRCMWERWNEDSNLACDSFYPLRREQCVELIYIYMCVYERDVIETKRK